MNYIYKQIYPYKHFLGVFQLAEFAYLMLKPTRQAKGQWSGSLDWLSGWFEQQWVIIKWFLMHVIFYFKQIAFKVFLIYRLTRGYYGPLTKRVSGISTRTSEKSSEDVFCSMVCRYFPFFGWQHILLRSQRAGFALSTDRVPSWLGSSILKHEKKGSLLLNYSIYHVFLYSFTKKQMFTWMFSQSSVFDHLFSFSTFCVWLLGISYHL